jgi:hypothetical protein
VKAKERKPRKLRGKDAPVSFHAAEGAFDLVAFFVEGAVVAPSVETVGSAAHREHAEGEQLTMRHVGGRYHLISIATLSPTFRVLNMKASVQFYRNVLGMDLLYGGEQASFSSLRANDSASCNPKRRTRRHCVAVGPADLPRYGCGCVLDREDLSLNSHGTRLGVNAISICSIRMVTSCRLLIRYHELAKRMRPREMCVAVTVDQRRLSELWLDHGQTESCPFVSGLVREKRATRKLSVHLADPYRPFREVTIYSTGKIGR